MPVAGDPALTVSPVFEEPKLDPDPEVESVPEPVGEGPESELDSEPDPDSGELLAEGMYAVPVFFEHFVL